MKILLHIPGDFNDGLDSNVRGEGRWSLNFGHMMSQHGHEVVFMGNPGKGEVSGCKVVSFGDPATFGEFDVFGDSTWLRARGEEIDAKVNLHMYWGHDSVSANVRKEYGKGHYSTLATYSVYQYVPEEEKDYVKILPFPVAEKFLWDKSNFDADGLYINWKFAMEDEWAARRSIVSHTLLNVALDLAEEFKMPLHILHAEHFFGGHPGVRVNMKPELRARLLNSPLVKPKVECAWKDSLALLGSSRLMITNAEPPVSPMPVEAVALGTLPMQYETNIFEYKGPYAFKYIEDVEYYKGPVKQALREMCSYRNVYDNILRRMRTLGNLYTYDWAYKVCLELLEELLEENP